VLVCDNASTDDSWENMKAWAEGRFAPDVAADFPLRHLILPRVPKPIPYLEYSDATDMRRPQKCDVPLVLIQTGTNLGFAGGNNVALRYAQSQGDYEYIWIINNDTLVQPLTLSHLVDKLRSAPSYGMCGGTVVYQHVPHLIQARGGNTYVPWLGRTTPLGFLETPETEVCETHIEARMACVSGACLLVSKALVQTVGYLSEIYFLYFEELDWALRARQHGYQLAYAARAIMYHQEGASIGGGNRDRAHKSWTADYFEIRNRLVFTRKFYPWAVPLVCLALLVTLGNRLRRRQWDRLGLVCKTVIDAFRVRLDTR